MLVPAYNEKVGIDRAVRSLLASDYPDSDVIVVDDRSTDRATEIVGLIESSKLRLVRQVNGGKASALNTGVELSQSDVIVMVDGDTRFEANTVGRLVSTLFDERVAAVSGNTEVGNRRGLLGRWQHIEYVIGVNLDFASRRTPMHSNRAWCNGCLPPRRARRGGRGTGGHPGGGHRSHAGHRSNRPAGRVRRGRPRVDRGSVEPRTLWRQRNRWSFVTMQAVFKHRRAIYGVLFNGVIRTLTVWAAFNIVQLIVAVNMYAFRLIGG
ncbi:MAG: glycosyltransferase family 2 protein [Solirubrobacteraceae bacterium]